MGQPIYNPKPFSLNPNLLMTSRVGRFPPPLKLNSALPSLQLGPEAPPPLTTPFYAPLLFAIRFRAHPACNHPQPLSILCATREKGNKAKNHNLCPLFQTLFLFSIFKLKLASHLLTFLWRSRQNLPTSIQKRKLEMPWNGTTPNQSLAGTPSSSSLANLAYRNIQTSP